MNLHGLIMLVSVIVRTLILLDWTVRDPAERARVDRNTVSSIETGAYAGAQDPGCNPPNSGTGGRRIHQRRCAGREAEDEMTSPESALHVEVLDDEIAITLSGTNYAVTYYRATAFPQRILTKSHSGGEDHDAPMTQVEFHGRAWRLANDKARELGWIA